MNEPLFIAIIGVQWLCIVGLAVLVIASMRHLAFLYERLDPVFKFQTNLPSLREGELLPDIGLTDLRRGPVTPNAWIGEQTLLMFAQPRCSACEDLLQATGIAINRVAAEGSMRVCVIVLANAESAFRIAENAGLDAAVEVLSDERAQTLERWGVTTTPSAILLGADGRVSKKFGTLNSAQILDLLRPNVVRGGPVQSAAYTQTKIGG